MSERETNAVLKKPAGLPEALDIPTGTLTEEDAYAIYRQGPEAVVFVILRLAKERAELLQKLSAQVEASPSTPSGMIAVYEKPPSADAGRSPGERKGMRVPGGPSKGWRHRKYTLEHQHDPPRLCDLVCRAEGTCVGSTPRVTRF